MIVFKKDKNKFIFFRNNKPIKTNSDLNVYVKNINHAKIFIEEFSDKNKNKDQYSNLNLTNFACDLNEKDIAEIIENLLKHINFDLIIYRSFDDKELISSLDKHLNIFLNTFNKEFKTQLKVISNLNQKSTEINKERFENYLKKLDIFKLSIIYKLSGITKSVVLSYFFLEKKISCLQLFKLTNIENNFQQKKWGYVDEQKKNDVYVNEILKKISFFLKIII
ncbi:MAG: hypothetical protein CMP32_01450 [Rickettsiales bacterium]|nr:hypothetical protein [Rickettsiales bacterium]|tara:strand:- start:1074 stop:1739 length:666 start_codon:yes stop_codon:yes gene_type:complete